LKSAKGIGQRFGAYPAQSFLKVCESQDGEVAKRVDDEQSPFLADHINDSFNRAEALIDVLGYYFPLL
jgi:hypothetical protein